MNDCNSIYNFVKKFRETLNVQKKFELMKFEEDLEKLCRRNLIHRESQNELIEQSKEIKQKWNG